MGSKWYRFINGVFGVIYSFALGDAAVRSVIYGGRRGDVRRKRFSVRGLLRCGYGVFLPDVYR